MTTALHSASARAAYNRVDGVIRTTAKIGHPSVAKKAFESVNGRLEKGGGCGWQSKEDQ